MRGVAPDTGTFASAKSRVGAISPDGKLVALAGGDGSIYSWDILTGKELPVLKGHSISVNALAFSADGKRLASASDDTTALIWDVTKIPRPALPAKAVQPADLKGWWQELAEDNAAKAFAALGGFVAAPKDSVKWIKERVKPAVAVDEKHVKDLIRDLDDQAHKVRENASAELLNIGERLLPVFEEALKGKPGLESQRRLEALRNKVGIVPLQGERLRAVRAVEVLELIGTPEARQLLQALAKGAPGALITTSAQAAIDR